MRMAIIYRPRGSAAPMEAAPMLMGALSQWVDKYSTRFSTLEFFAYGGGFVLGDFDDPAEVNRLGAGKPLTPVMGGGVIPVVDPGTAMATFGEVMAQLAGGAQPAS